MRSRLGIGGLVVVVALAALPLERAQSAERFPTLHEVIRHFEVAFVDRANLAALLLGGLQGLKGAAPALTIQVAPIPDIFVVKAKGKSVTVPMGAALDFKQLEQSLGKAGALALDTGLSKDAKGLEHAMIRQLVSSCGDPWSIFLEADLYVRLLDDGTAVVGEAGLLLENLGGSLQVLDATPAAPAFLAGIRPGMKVDSIAGKNAAKLNELEALAMLRGKVGDKVELSVDGKGYTLTLAAEPTQNIEVDTPAGGIARIHLLNFKAGTGEHLAMVLPKVEDFYRGKGEKLKGLVLDLRGNPGGLVTEGRDVVGLFINAGKVVSVKSKKQMRVEVEESKTPGPYRGLPLVLLVDHRSASVSEIVALALRDYDRAKLVGTKTLGKGNVQVVMELMDGSALKLSTGRYYSPGGTPLYEGIEPDMEVPWDGKGDDAQLKKAMQLLGG